MSDDLASLGIDGNDTTRFGELSRGERQRVAVVRSAVTDPSIIVADEPTSGLGAEETRKVLELLASTNATVLVATHDQQVIDWSDDVYELANGRLRRLSR
jgi:ABC-type lipoprotein export system ATPase subunit